METLKGKIALITGVGREKGIGIAICRELAKNGVDIFFTYWHPYDLENYIETEKENPTDFIEELKRYGVRVASAEIDLSKPKSPERLFKMVVKELGTPDILINNAAVSMHASFREITSDMLDKHFAVNVRAPGLLCKEFVKAWDKDIGGRIINMTSGQSLGIMRDEIPYTITKASVEMLTKQLAPEFDARGIKIIALDPGPTDTGWMDDSLKKKIIEESPKGRLTMPEDIAQVITTILTDNTQVSGQVIHAER
jgi:3-oxoacyl-[acyl-carrier protein] reductase